MSTIPTLHEDPSIRECAKHLLCEAMDDINRRVACGDSFWMARTRVLEMHADEWVRLYGKQTADIAARGLHCLAPSEVLDRATKQGQRARRIAKCRADLAAYDPGRNTWINRAALSLIGRRLYALAFLVLACLPLGSPVEAATNSSRWRALALCGVAKTSTEREHACRNFNRAQRSTWRGYDHRGGTPRSWELPRAWEIAP